MDELLDTYAQLAQERRQAASMALAHGDWHLAKLWVASARRIDRIARSVWTPSGVYV